MAKMTAIAEILGVSENAAREYCLAVQALHGNPVPSFRAIGFYLEKSPQAYGDPSVLADLIKQSPRVFPTARRAVARLKRRKAKHGPQRRYPKAAAPSSVSLE